MKTFNVTFTELKLDEAVIEAESKETLLIYDKTVKKN